MDITITVATDEINQAIQDYLAKHGILPQGKEAKIELVAGRGSVGHTAMITLKGVGVAQLAAAIANGGAPEAEKEDPFKIPDAKPDIVPSPAAQKRTRASKAAAEPEVTQTTVETPAAEKGLDATLTAAADMVNEKVEDLFSEAADTDSLDENSVTEGDNPASNDDLESLFNA
jgi:hypothetical protein